MTTLAANGVTKPVLVALLLSVFCLPFILSAQPAQFYKPNVSRVLFILDGSGSMNQKWNDKSKFETAKNLLFKIIDSVERQNPNVEFGVRVFGYQYSHELHNCKDSKLMLPFAKNNASKIDAALGGIKPQGMSPIAYSLQLGAKDFPDDPKSLNSIVLITDGEENCDGDPCDASKDLSKKRISLKPFIVGINVEAAQAKKFNCVGTFYDTKDEASFYNTVGVIISQTLNTTTAQVNLVDKNGNPSITNIPFTLYDHYSGKIEYNFVHTMNEKGNPDTLFLDPVGVYDIELHTVPSVRKENIELTPGKHNIIALNVPAGDLNVACNGSSAANNGARVVVRQPDDLKNMLSVQDMNESVKYLEGNYHLEILTAPGIIKDTTVVAMAEADVKIPGYGSLSVASPVECWASMYYVHTSGELQMVDRFETSVKSTVRRYQPGNYVLVYKPKNNYSSGSTKTLRLTIEEGRTAAFSL